MEIIIRSNSVYLKKVNLGKNFADLIADLTVDRYGKVKVKTQSNLPFYTNLDYLPSTILETISERLEKNASNRILTRINKKIVSALDIRTMQKSVNENQET